MTATETTLPILLDEYIYSVAYIANFAANPTTTDKYGNTPLHYSADFAHNGALSTYLSTSMRHMNMNHMNVLGQTALSRALHTFQHTSDAATDIRTFVRTLLETKNVAPDTGYELGAPTPLMLSVIRGDVELVRMLLAAGSDPTCRLGTDGLFLKKGDTALSIAVRLHTLTGDTAAVITQEQLNIIMALLHSPRMTPEIIFHATVRIRDPMLKNTIMCFRSLNLEPLVNI